MEDEVCGDMYSWFSVIDKSYKAFVCDPKIAKNHFSSLVRYANARYSASANDIVMVFCFFGFPRD